MFLLAQCVQIQFEAVVLPHVDTRKLVWKVKLLQSC